VSRSTNEGDAWSEPIRLKSPTPIDGLDDKESITPISVDISFVYAVWDRLEFTDANPDLSLSGAYPVSLGRRTAVGPWERSRVIYVQARRPKPSPINIVVLAERRSGQPARAHTPTNNETLRQSTISPSS